MANSFSAVAPLLFSAARIVPRELTGLIAAVDTNFDDKGVAKGDTVTVPVSPIASIGDFTPAQNFTAGTDRTATSKILTLSQEKVSSWNLTPEQELSLGNGGNADDVFMQTVKQHLRTHVNAMESYLWGVTRKAASRSYGTAGTSPFATDQKPLAQALKIMLDNGAGNQDLSCVFDTVAGADLRSVSNLFKVSEAGNDSLLRNGVLGRLYNFDLRESAAVTSVTKGTMTGALVNSGALAVGSTSIPFDTGTAGATGFIAGDTITFAADTANKYIIATGVNAASGTIVIQEPGLRVAIPDNNAITVGNNATQNVFLRKDAVKFVQRPGLQPAGGGVDQWTIADDQTGMSFLVYRAVGDGIASWYMRTVYDAFGVNNYAIGQLLG